MAKNKFGIAVLLCLFVGICSYGQSPLRKRVIDTALAEVGVKELTGKNDGHAVEKYLKVCGLPKGYAWCAAFISWNYQVNCVTTFKSAWAPSWFPKNKALKPGAIPQPGDVGGIWISDRIGHVFFIYKWDAKITQTIEGNTNEAGSREGDGVYIKRRLTRQIYKTANWID
jgi:hypothetical protein